MVVGESGQGRGFKAGENTVRLVVTDLDGTLLSSSKEITSENRRAIVKMQLAGVDLMLASGRAWLSIRPYYELLGLQTPCITANGAEVIDHSSGRILSRQELDPQARRTALELAQDSDLLVFCADHERIYAGGQKIELKHVHENVAVSIGWCQDLIIEAPENLTRITLVGQNSELLNFQQKMIQSGVRATVEFTGETWMEIIAPGVSKGIALTELAQAADIDLAEIMTIGDGPNDVSMLTVAGYSVAMGNAAEEIKQQARFVAPDNDSAGFAWAIENIVLSEASS